MNQAVQKQVLNALLNLYLEASTCDGFNPNLEGPENDAKEAALKALQAAGVLDGEGHYILGGKRNDFPPPQNMVKEIKDKYPPGTRIRIDSTPFDPHPVPEGTYGTVESVDDAGQLQMRWDNGRTLAVIPGTDEFTVLTISLDDFVATRTFVEDLEKAIGFDNNEPNVKGFVYKGSFYIEQLEDGSYRLPLGRDEYIEPKENLSKLEKILYDQHFHY